MPQAASISLKDLVESLNNLSTQQCFRDKYFLLQDEYQRNFPAYEDAAILLSGNERDGRDIAQEAFLRAFMDIDEWTPAVTPCQNYILVLMHDIIEEHEEEKLQIEQNMGYLQLDWLKEKQSPSAEFFNEQNLLQREFRRCLGEMENLSTQELLALFSQICRKSQIGNMLSIEAVNPEDLERAKGKCAQNPALKALLNELD